MNHPLARLFEPAAWGKLQSKNRIKYGSCCVSNYNNRDGTHTIRELARTQVIAQTGCGIITNQGAYPDPLGEGKGYFRQVAIYDDSCIPEFEKIAGYIHDAGAIAVQQVLHAGRYGGIDLGYCLQPSIVPQTLPHFRPPREITKEQIRATVQQHAEAARRALKAGFDATEVTSFMGYLLATFNSKFTNRRTDEYGGSLKNRGRFMCELIDAMKQAQGDAPLVIRLNGNELMDRWGGNTEDECFELMQMAAERGVDMISVTVGWQEAPESSIGRDVPPGYWRRLAARAKKMLPGTPIAFGNRLPDPHMAAQCIADGEFDFWEVCRPMLADPELVHKAAAGRMDEVKRCIGSLNCLSRLFRDLPYTCTRNPQLGHEYDPAYQLTPAPMAKKIMVIGAGPAGMECAITAKRRGHDVIVFERGAAIGGALAGYAKNDLANSDDLTSVVAYYRKMAEALAIEVRLNSTIDVKAMRSMLHRYDVAVIATGARIDSRFLPECTQPGLLVDALDVAAERVGTGARVVVLGGGKVGLTLAESLKKNHGREVTVVDSDKRIAGDVMPSFKWRHTAWIEELGIPTRTGARVLAIGAGGVQIRTAQGEEEFLPADTVISAVERRPNQELFHELEWMIDEVHGCGDSLVPRGLTQAIHDGFRLGARI
ncbi:MAG: FAD-dependent oxidoreductase [Proteobacteria bacterium]|nr:FAD-dependent oxidoreductase [Pseudomonadota bacterium]